jgi:hypothetical protein
MIGDGRQHIVVVEAYQGDTELLSDEPAKVQAARGLGLPLEDIAAMLNCRITVFYWDEWYPYEITENWLLRCPTRPVLPSNRTRELKTVSSGRVKFFPLPAQDPEYRLPFATMGLSPRSHGLINDSGLLFFVSYCLNKELETFYRDDPFQALVLPAWGGLGYVWQMARATGAPNVVDVPCAVVVTNTSARRQTANHEGYWTRHAIIRRQMEDVSLALADQTLVFGPVGAQIATSGRLPEAPPPVFAPRFVDNSLIDKIAAAAVQPIPNQKLLEFFLYEPQQAACGVLAALDAVNILAQRGVQFDRPVVSAGPSVTFAPMYPQGFADYWSSRGFVRRLISDNRWNWQPKYSRSTSVYPVRLYPALFDHLPYIWHELAQGSLVLLSPSAAEGLAPGQPLPPEVLIDGPLTPETLAGCLEKIIRAGHNRLEEIRQALCTQVVAAFHGEERRQQLAATVQVFRQLLQGSSQPQDLGRVALTFLDRRVPLAVQAQNYKTPTDANPVPGITPGALSVVVTCYEMGAMVSQAVESVWAAGYHPNEVLLIDDGSHGEETLAHIRALEQKAAQHGKVFRVIRQPNQGLAAARNTGLNAATGEFISFLDGDDIVEPQFYQIALHNLKKYPRLGGVAAWALIFGENIPDGFWNAAQPEFPFLLMENSVIVPCVTRTALLRHLGGYDSLQRYNYEDWELSVRILAAGWPIVTVPAHLVKYRVRQDSLYRTMTFTQNQVMRELMLATHRDTVSRFAVEFAMQLEHELTKLVYSAGEAVTIKDLRHGTRPSSEMPALRQIAAKFGPALSDAFKMILSTIRQKVFPAAARPKGF